MAKDPNRTITMYGDKYTYDKDKNKWMSGKKEASASISAMLDIVVKELGPQGEEEVESFVGSANIVNETNEPETTPEEQQAKDDAHERKEEAQDNIEDSPPPAEIEKETVAEPVKPQPIDTSTLKPPAPEAEPVQNEKSVVEQTPFQRRAETLKDEYSERLRERLADRMPLMRLFTDKLEDPKKPRKAPDAEPLKSDSINTDLTPDLKSNSINTDLTPEQTPFERRFGRMKDEYQERLRERLAKRMPLMRLFTDKLEDPKNAANKESISAAPVSGGSSSKETPKSIFGGLSKDAIDALKSMDKNIKELLSIFKDTKKEQKEEIKKEEAREEQKEDKAQEQETAASVAALEKREFEEKPEMALKSPESEPAAVKAAASSTSFPMKQPQVMTAAEEDKAQEQETAASVAALEKREFEEGRDQKPEMALKSPESEPAAVKAAMKQPQVMTAAEEDNSGGFVGDALQEYGEYKLGKGLYNKSKKIFLGFKKKLGVGKVAEEVAEELPAKPARDALGRFTKKPLEVVAQKSEGFLGTNGIKGLNKVKGMLGLEETGVKTAEKVGAKTLAKTAEKVGAKTLAKTAEKVGAKTLAKTAEKVGAKTAEKVGAKTAEKVGAKTLAKTAEKVGAKTLAKTAEKVEVGAKTLAKTAEKVGAKTLAKTAGKSLLKKIPGVGLLAGLAFGAGRLMKGDLLGAAGEVGSGLASTVPGVGTAASVAIDAGLAARDMTQPEEDAEKEPTAYALGGTVSNPRPLKFFADGGVVNSPTAFSHDGGTGVMGEAGPEAILPLEKGSDGKLGVKMMQADPVKKAGITPQTSALEQAEEQRRVAEKRNDSAASAKSPTIINNTMNTNNNQSGGGGGAVTATAGPRNSLDLNYYAQ